MLNGDGLRVVLWVSGCENKCKGCQNPQTWDVHSGRQFTYLDESQLHKELDKKHISGVTFSGGDPLYPDNREHIYEIIRRIREKYGDTKTIWLYTGYKFEDIMCLPLVWMCDVIVDGKFIEELKDVNYPWAGSTNQRVIHIKKLIEHIHTHLANGEY
jgi:anaerobic ribonucleoside-triphosphate reductase activating protein